MARWLKFDLAADRAADADMRERARHIVAEAAAEPADPPRSGGLRVPSSAARGRARWMV
ncbi:hypothetical protein [Actinoplanes sp. NPDC051411]|uniref:hypothetical protein n=1 Tax=Actinoplanes sp. NPDC051411 TaxID=3155522 RepID=UPI003449C181